MYKIQGKEKTVKELLDKTRYSIDYYQREYRWEEKNIQELLDDLSGKFFESYQEGDERTDVEEYSRYYLGAIIVCERDGVKYIVDGQQRLTSLTLLLIYLNNLQRGREEQVDISDLIYSERYGQKTFNLNIEERLQIIEALFEDKDFDINDEHESIQNIWNRYQDIENEFPEDLKSEALPFFIDWLTDNVDLVKITAYKDEDAYLIFETMNDRGQQLTATDMLKAYLLANITNESIRDRLNEEWKANIHELRQFSKDEDSDFFRAWFRAIYAETIRERKRGAQNQDYEKIARYHKWVRENDNRIGLTNSTDFEKFLEQDFKFYRKWYIQLRKYSNNYNPEYEHVFYNANNNFTLQYQLILSSLIPGEAVSETERKISLVSYFMDYYFMQRVVNYKSLSYSDMFYNIFLISKKLRRKSLNEVHGLLKKEIENNEYKLNGASKVRLNSFTKRYLHYLLARITHFIETESDLNSEIAAYLNVNKRNYQIEHIWADKFQRHTDEFDNEYEFREFRNRFGGLLLLPRKFNQSYGDMKYSDKLDHYNAQNLLARSLHHSCYQNNPGFNQMREHFGLSFQPHEEFKKEDLILRQELYTEIIKQIWNLDKLEKLGIG